MAIIVLDFIFAGRLAARSASSRGNFGWGGDTPQAAQHRKRFEVVMMFWETSGIKANDTERKKLVAELEAIEQWDHDYRAESEHDRLDDDAYKRRQERRLEIMKSRLWNRAGG